MGKPNTHRTYADVAVHIPRIRRLARALTRDSAEAEDLVQDTVVAYLATQHPPDGDLRPWLEAVLKNLYRLNVRARVRRMRREELHSDISESLSSEFTAWWQEARLTAVMQQELDKLPISLSQPLRLSYIEGLNSFQVAERLGLPAATVRSRNQKALRLLRQRIERHERKAGETWRSLFVWIVRPFRRLIMARPLSDGGAIVAIAAIAAIAALIILPQPRASDSFSRSDAQASVMHLTASDLVKDNVQAPQPARVEHSDPVPYSERPAMAASELTTTGGRDARAHSFALEACASLSRLVAEASAGTVLRLPPCLFREAITVERPLQIEGAEGTEITGSDVFEFEPEGPLYVSRQVIPESILVQDCPPLAKEACVTGEQVFLDGRRLRRASGETLHPHRSYAVTASRKVALNFNPEHHLIEVTVRTFALRVASNDVTIRNVRFTKVATLGARSGAVSVTEPYLRFRFESNTIADTSGLALAVGGNGHIVASNVIYNSGLEGIFLTPSRDAQIRHNRLHNNGGALAPKKFGYSGSLTAILSDANIEDNVVTGSFTGGVYCVGCEGARIARNFLTQNSGSGLIVLKSNKLQLGDNVLRANALQSANAAGISILGSTDVDVWRNTLLQHTLGIKLEALAPQPQCSFVANNRLHGNTIIESPVTGAIVVAPGHCPSDQSQNRFWFSAQQLWASVDGEGRHLISNDEKARHLAHAGIWAHAL